MLSAQVNSSHWLAISQEWEQSNLTQIEYCKSKGISRSYFTQQRTKLMAQGLLKPCYKQTKSKSPSPKMRFLPLTLAASDTLPQPKITPTFIEIQLPHGIVVRIPTC
jgi:hypothetical protein